MENINKTIVPGIIDGANIYIKIEFAEGKLSISGNHAGGGGQCIDALDDITEYLNGYNAETVQKLKAVWSEWHLNDLNAGCEHQSKYLKEHPDQNKDYNELTKLPDFAECPKCKYKYGSAWLKVEVPQTVLRFLKGLKAYELQGESSYEDQANQFLKSTGTEILTEFMKNDKYFPDDTETRDIYQVTMKRGDREYKFRFGQSIADSGMLLHQSNGKRTRHQGFRVPDDIRKKFEAGEKYGRMNIRQWFKQRHFDLTTNEKIIFKHPTPYDILACLTKNEPEDFEYFCNEFGYDTDSKQAEKIHKAVKEEWLNLQRMFNDLEIDRLRDIQ